MLTYISRWTLACVMVLALQAGPASAQLIDPRICERPNLSPETQAYCDRIVGLSGRDLYKATAEENLRRTNQSPVADLKLARTLDSAIVLPGRVDLDATGSTDDDGFPHFYTYQLFDDDTGQVLAGPLTTRKPVGTLQVDGELPPNLRAVVIVEDDERATDTAELAFAR